MYIIKMANFVASSSLHISRFLLQDLNECIMGEASCSVNARCLDTDGAYDCTCNAGFTGDGYLCKGK